MRSILAVFFALLVAWNSIASASDVFMLCLHHEGGLHIELIDKSAHQAETECCDVESSISERACPPCTDLVLEPSDLAMARSYGMGSIESPTSPLASEGTLLADTFPQPSFKMERACPTRGPPRLEPISNLIRRVVVLRL